MKRRPRYAVKDHLPPWMLSLVPEAKQLLAASPYVTDERLFKSCASSDSRLYTDFSPINFISGASSLRILRKIISRNIAVYHVDGLHAKVVMINGKYFSIGSQNLTFGGRHHNIEASFVGGTEAPPAEVANFFERIHAISESLTLEDIDRMHHLVAPLQKKFKVISRQEKQIKISTQEERKVREIERKTQLQREQMERARNKALNLFNGNQKSATISAQVKKIYNNAYGDFDWTPSSTISLVPAAAGDFTSLISLLGVRPIRLSRYLMINLENGKLAYVRLAKTRISYFANVLTPHETFVYQRNTFVVRIKFEWDKEKLKDYNIRVEISDSIMGNKPFGAAEFAFSVEGLDLQRTEILGHPQYKIGPKPAWDMDALLSSVELSNFTAMQLIKPFVYKESLAGNSATGYFEAGVDSRFEIKSIKWQAGVVLSARKV